jgi:VanZ family protein
MAGVILYGSFYPFDFRVPAGGIGPVATFIASIGDRPGRGDFIANILLYLPFGFFFVLSFAATHRRVAVPLAVLCGALMSLSVELTQYYDAGRVTAFSDFYTNVLGSLLGAITALVMGARFRIPYVGEVTAQPIPMLLIIAWLAYRMYPYVPTIDLHKYWNALKPIVLTPSLVPYDLFRETAIWLGLYALIEAIVGRRRSAWLALLFAVCVLFAKILIVGTVLRLAEPAGAALAFVLWLGVLLLPARGRFGVAGLVVCAYVFALRLEPFQFEPMARDFGWIPFYGLMHGSLQVDALSFLEKFFLYGSMIFLLGSAIRSRFVATVFVTLLLFSTSWAETYLPGRSAEITDAVMAVLIGVVFALLPSGEAAAAPRGMSLSAREKRMRDWQRAQARALGVEVEE